MPKGDVAEDRLTIWPRPLQEFVFDLGCQLFNLLNGRTRADDMVPARFFEEEMEAGLLKGKKMSRDMFEGLKDDYYAKRGWDAEGVPTDGKLEELGLGRLG